MQIAFSPTPSPSPAAAAAGAPAAAGDTAPAFGDVFQQLIGTWAEADAGAAVAREAPGAPVASRRRAAIGDDAAAQDEADADQTQRESGMAVIVTVDVPHPSSPVSPLWGFPASSSGSAPALRAVETNVASPHASANSGSASIGTAGLTAPAADTPRAATTPTARAAQTAARNSADTTAPLTIPQPTAPPDGSAQEVVTVPAGENAPEAQAGAVPDAVATATAATALPNASTAAQASAPAIPAVAAARTSATRVAASATPATATATMAATEVDASPAGPHGIALAAPVAHEPPDDTRDESGPSPHPAAMHHALQRIGAQLSVAPDHTVSSAVPASLPSAGPVTTSQAAAAADHIVAPQIVQAMRLLATDGGGEARVLLKPEYLGEVLILVKVADGGVTATVQAESPAVRQWAETHEPSLRQALGAQGLRLEQLTVSAEVPDAAPADRQADEPPADPRNRQQQRPRRPRADADAERFEIVL